jgi:hypothetical protein
MSYRQYITPNPNIPCTAGWCLQYVRQAFGLPAKYGTAIEAWNASRFKHRDYNFPAGAWVPLWFTVKGVPAGHVVLRAPDGRIYSTTALGRTTATIHPNLAHLMSVYAGADLALTYQGWTEDVASYLVVKAVSTPKPVSKPAPAPAGKLLKVTAPVARVRTSPAVRSNNIAPGYPDGIAKGATIAAVGYVRGEDPFPNDRSTDDAWIKTKSGYYIWANNVGNSLAGLKKLN